MLSSLLPGLRDLRGPLAAGYLWLLNLWFWYGDRIPTKDEADATGGFFAEIYALDDVVSQFGLVVALSFAAHLLGAVSSSASNLILFLIKRLPIRAYTPSYLGGSSDE